jgi:hypothetical protein
MRTGTLRRHALRLLAPLLALAVAGGVVAATGQPAQARACSSFGEVYVIVPEVLRANQFEPINRGFYDLTYDVPSNGASVAFQLGGSGLKPNEDPFWGYVLESNGQYIGTLINTRTNSNCISNQRYHSVYGYPGTSYLFYATYEPGNTGGVIRNQQHFRITFV